MFNLDLSFLCSLFGYIVVFSVLMIILAPSPVHIVLFGITFYFFFGCIIVFCGYDFLGLTLIIVYAGALMVMFLFVVMAFDLARSSVLDQTSFFGVSVVLWVRLVVFLFFFSVLFFLVDQFSLLSFGRDTYSYVFLNDGALLFVCDSFVFTNFISQSILSDLGLSFYSGFSLTLFLCGVLLIVGLVGAVGLARSVAFSFLKRRVRRFSEESTFVDRRILVVS